MAGPLAALNGAGLGSPAVADLPVSAHPRGGFGFRRRRRGGPRGAFRPGPPAASRRGSVGRPGSRAIAWNRGSARSAAPAATQRDHPDSRRRQRRQPALGQLEQVAGVSRPVRAERDDEIVADLLGRLLDPPRQHPEQRLHPQRRGGQLPDQVPQPVAAAQMRQFVDEGITQVLLRVLRQQDGRPRRPSRHGLDRKGERRTPGSLSRIRPASSWHSACGLGLGRDGRPSQASHAAVADQQPHGEDRRTQQPERQYDRGHRGDPIRAGHRLDRFWCCPRTEDARRLGGRRRADRRSHRIQGLRDSPAEGAMALRSNEVGIAWNPAGRWVRLDPAHDQRPRSCHPPPRWAPGSPGRGIPSRRSPSTRWDRPRRRRGSCDRGPTGRPAPAPSGTGRPAGRRSRARSTGSTRSRPHRSEPRNRL